jgi:3'-phosphoadenosine 5'-phosphosulfate sulfotransferase (PAPS reductase)/FAD synthetase
MSVRHVVSVSSGKDSTALLLLALERCPPGTVVPIFCDTGNEHQAVYDYLAYLEQALGVTITRLRADFTDRFAPRRMFIARDDRIKREYRTRPVFQDDGKTPVLKRDGRGNIVYNKKGKPVQKTVKVGGGRRVRWSNKARRRALAALQPSGNPFLDLCMLKGLFPSRKAQFCTEELKRNIAVEFQLELQDQGHRVISWQGVRRDESEARRDAKLAERIGPGIWAFRPLVEWTAAQVFDFSGVRGIHPNPLYLQGAGRVGCMPCINCSKGELRQIALRWPEHLHRISEWEHIVGQCSKRGFSTFFADSHKARDRRQVFADLNVWTRIQWAKTTRGGRQFDLLAQLDEPTACASSYGLCDQAAPALPPAAAEPAQAPTAAAAPGREATTEEFKGHAYA